MKNTNSIIFIFLVIFFSLNSCTDTNEDINNYDDNIFLNTTWEYTDENFNIAILKFKENNTVLWEHRAIDYQGNAFFTGTYEEKFPFVTIKLYFSSITIWEGIFKDSQLVIYDTESKTVLYKLSKKIK